jgi:hypothetical protein
LAVVVLVGLGVAAYALRPTGAGDDASVGASQSAAPPGEPSAVTTTDSPPPAPPAERPEPRAARVFAWVRAEGASHYRVEFFRGATKIFDARPSRTRITLPRRWTFRGRRYELLPGRYRWQVRPGVGSRADARYGQPIVRATLTIDKS